jgi:hypothetical protein
VYLSYQKKVPFFIACGPGGAAAYRGELLMIGINKENKKNIKKTTGSFFDIVFISFLRISFFGNKYSKEIHSSLINIKHLC